MRIVSLVPAATELLFALGRGADVVGVTHECDYPEAARSLPQITRDTLPEGLTPGQIDAAVRARTQHGEAIYELDEAALIALRPDLIVTQALCAVCAVSHDDVRAIAERIDPSPQVIALDPHTFGEVLGDVRTLAEATGSRDAGVDLIADASARIDRVRLAVRGRPPLKVAALEWLDPLYIAGHWTPQLIDMAGGTDLLGFAGEHSEQLEWELLEAAKPEVVVCIPCGYDGPRALAEAEQFGDRLRALGAKDVVALDAAAYFSRPGPRLVGGLETLAHALHPDRVTEAPGRVHRVML
jgi:iron complex transport system substrate-binding protein